jgi:hypothetical protein
LGFSPEAAIMLLPKVMLLFSPVLAPVRVCVVKLVAVSVALVMVAGANRFQF